jgi:hypothetical protein
MAADQPDVAGSELMDVFLDQLAGFFLLFNRIDFAFRNLSGCLQRQAPGPGADIHNCVSRFQSQQPGGENPDAFFCHRDPGTDKFTVFIGQISSVHASPAIITTAIPFSL